MKRRKQQLGFTLIEIIAILVVVGFVGIMTANFFNAGISKSNLANEQLQVEAALQQVMENMIQCFKVNNALGGLLTSGNACYVGTSGMDQSNYFGSYYLQAASYMSLDTTTRVFSVSGSVTNYVRVTIKPSASSGSSLTYIFASQ